MNVYIDRLARTMAGRGIEVDVFTRRIDPAQPEDVVVAPGYRVVHVAAGPEESLPTAELAELVQEFALGVVKWRRGRRASSDRHAASRTAAPSRRRPRHRRPGGPKEIQKTSRVGEGPSRHRQLAPERSPDLEGDGQTDGADLAVFLGG